MPRLPPSLLRHAHTLHPYLPLLLPATRSLSLALAELRWLQAHVSQLVSLRKPRSPLSFPISPSSLSSRYPTSHSRSPPYTLLKSLCLRRQAGEPLQYILRSQPFSGLEILCAKGVLIPRPETETWTLWLAELLNTHHGYVEEHLSSVSCTDSDGPGVQKSSVPALVGQAYEELEQEQEQEQNGYVPKTKRERQGEKQRQQQNRTLRVLDLCAGSGCISLALLSDIHKRFSSGVEVQAVDVSPKAREVALKSLRLNQRLGRLPDLDERSRGFNYRIGDVLELGFCAWENGLKGLNTETEQLRLDKDEEVDVLVANPPYISPWGFQKDTMRSVRAWEPRLALLPPQQKEASARSAAQSGETGDLFYGPIVDIAMRHRAKVVVMEVGDWAQAVRVAEIAREKGEELMKRRAGATEESPGVARRCWEKIQIWCDEPYTRDSKRKEANAWERLFGENIEVIGSGNVRVVVLGREWGAHVLTEAG